MWLRKNIKTLVLAALVVAVGYAWFSQRSRAGVAGETPSDLTTGLPKMVELYTPTCPSCLAMEPLIERLKAKCAPQGVGFDKIDISMAENEHIAEELGLFAVPTFIFLDQAGTEVSRLVGQQTESTLKKHLATLGGECSDRS
jgi:thiol-disulfide isomerase/thioredoxin